MANEEQKPIKIPPLRKKNRSLKELGAYSLAAALHWDKLAAQMSEEIPVDPPPVPTVSPVAPDEVSDAKPRVSR